MGCVILGSGRGWWGWVGTWEPQGPSTSIYAPRLPQSLFERQGLPGPEKLPGSLRKVIPRTKSVGMAGLGAARSGRSGAGLGWGLKQRGGTRWSWGGRTLCLPSLTWLSSFPQSPAFLGTSPGISCVSGHNVGVSLSPNPEILCETDP